jgi:hypothetical protein
MENFYACLIIFWIIFVIYRHIRFASCFHIRGRNKTGIKNSIKKWMPKISSENRGFYLQIGCHVKKGGHAETSWVVP